MLCEDATELAPAHPHVVRLLTRPANVEGAGEVTLRDLVRQALRMRPDRLVVGEVRGAEMTDLLAALNTGHDGGCGTLHANRPTEVPARLEALGVAAGLGRDAVHSQLAAALSVVVHLRRTAEGRRVDGARRRPAVRGPRRRRVRLAGGRRTLPGRGPAERAPRRGPDVTAALLAGGARVPGLAPRDRAGAGWTWSPAGRCATGPRVRAAAGARCWPGWRQLRSGPPPAPRSSPCSPRSRRSRRHAAASLRGGTGTGNDGCWPSPRGSGALAADLRSGRSVDAATAAAVAACADEESGRALARAVRAPAAGPAEEGDLGQALARISAAVLLSSRTGCSLAAVVAAVEDDLRARHRHRLELRSATAAPRASALLLAGLPVLGLAMGSGVGADPWAVLTTTGTGQVLLVAGVTLELAGVAWSRRLVDRALR